MIRLLIIAIGVFLLWVLFVSGFKKRTKIIISVCVLIFSGVGIWFEQADKGLRDNLIMIHEIVDCGVSAEHSYRTNYDVEFCLQNDSLKAMAKHINIDFIALSCLNGECLEIQNINEDVILSLAAQTSITLTKSLEFDKVPQEFENEATIVWSISVRSVKAIK